MDDTKRQAIIDWVNDYDLKACLEYNVANGLHFEDICKVLALHEGERDEEDWWWVLELHDGRYALLTGGCDYTGWDCQSSAKVWFYDNKTNLTLGIFIVCSLVKGSSVVGELMEQLAEDVPAQTWRQRRAAGMEFLKERFGSES